MGTKVQSKSCMPGYYPMRDLNEDSNSCSWSLYHEDKGFTDGQYYNGLLPKVTNDAYPGYDKDSVKQKILEHEAIFRKQVFELHRLYKVQRDMMDGVQRKELHGNRMQAETSLSPSPLASQITSEDAWKWTNNSFPLANSIYAGPSVSGVKGINSPFSSAKGNNMLTGPYSFQNGCRLKDIEMFESRPKVHRKTFDLQLPADEYIDTVGEQMSVDKLAGSSSSHPRNCTMAHENGVKFYLDNGQKTDDRIDARLRSSNGFADLNEPIQLEDVKETNTSPYNFCNGKIHDSDRSVKPNSQLLGFPNGTPLHSHGRTIDAQSSLHLHKNGNGSEWFSHVPEIGQTKSNSQFPQSSLQTQVSTSKAHQPTFYISDKSNGDFRKEEMVSGAQISRRPHNLTNDGKLPSLATSPITSLPEISSPELAKPWPHSWEKPSRNFSLKPLSSQTYGALDADSLNKSSLASVQRDGISGDKWYLSTNATSKPPFAGELPYRNGFYQGSSSGSKQQSIRIPSSSADFVRCSNEKVKAPGHWANKGLAQYCRSSNCVGMKSPKDMNLNVAISDSSSTREMPIPGAEKKHEDHLAGLPWLRPKPACKNEVVEFEHISKAGGTSMFQNSLSQSANMTEKAKDCNLHIAGSVKSSSSSEVQAKINEPNNCQSSKKLLGFPIFEKPNVSENDLPSRTSLPVSFLQPSENKVVNKLNVILDINLPCDPTTPDLFQQSEEASVVVDKVTDAKSASFRHHIDLNSCLSDDEASLKPSAPITRVKIMTEIDLEAPAVAEAEDVVATEESSSKPHEPPVTSPKSNDSEGLQDELITGAAEAIVAISAVICHNLVVDLSGNPPETPQNESAFADPLTWFAEIVSSCEDNLQGKLNSEDDSVEEFDHFESMILRLSETKEEDYMPAPLVPEASKQEESGPAIPTTRPRKGQGRRGRQRRDFQRDILPGLASLSRHEVTEDLQLFGGLMRATGHAWQSGSARRSSARNGGGRGRRQVAVSPPTTPSCGPPPPPPLPPMQMIKGVEAGLEDRSLTGWGKTTRRPRRQRCSAGNPTPIVLN